MTAPSHMSNNSNTEKQKREMVCQHPLYKTLERNLSKYIHHIIKGINALGNFYNDLTTRSLFPNPMHISSFESQ